MKSYTLYEFQRNLTLGERDLLIMEQVLHGETIVLTGKLGDAFSRADATAMLALWGAAVGSTVSASTTLLIATDPARNTQKRLDASAHGVCVMDEEDAVRWLEAKLEDARATLLSAPPPDPSGWFAGATPVEAEVEDMITPLTDYVR